MPKLRWILCVHSALQNPTKAQNIHTYRRHIISQVRFYPIAIILLKVHNTWTKSVWVVAKCIDVNISSCRHLYTQFVLSIYLSEKAFIFSRNDLTSIHSKNNPWRRLRSIPSESRLKTSLRSKLAQYTSHYLYDDDNKCVAYNEPVSKYPSGCW